MVTRYNATWTVIVERARSMLKARRQKGDYHCAFCKTGDDGLHTFTCPVPEARHILDMQGWIDRCEAKLVEKGIEGAAEQKVWRTDYCRLQAGKGDR